MPRQNILQAAFTSGEVSPLLAGRTDTKVYANGLRTCENFIVKPQGALTYRGGTKLVSPAKFHDSTARYVAFEFSDVQAYVLEFGVNYIRFHKNGVLLLETTSEITNNLQRSSDGGTPALMQVRATTPTTDTPSFLIDTLTPFNILGSGVVVVTTHRNHTIRTGVLVRISGTGTAMDGNPFTATYLTPYTFSLQGTTWAAPINITTVTNDGTGEYRITVGAAHDYQNGDTVVVAGSATGADGTWVVKDKTATTVDLTGSVFAGGSAGSGTIRRSIALGAGGHALYHGALVGDFVEVTANPAGRVIVKAVDDYHKLTLANVAYAAGTQGHMYSIPIEVVTDYLEADLTELKFAQSADVLYIFHPDYPTMKLTRLDNDGDHNDWLLSEVVWTDGPYLPLQNSAPNVDTTTPANGTNYPDVYLELSSYAHAATVTVAAAFINADDNKYFEYRDGDQWRLGKIGVVAGGETSVPCTIIDNILIHFDETTKFKGTFVKNILGSKREVTYDAGSPNASPSIPAAGVTKRVDPNNTLISNAAGGGAAGAGTLQSNYSNTFGTADVGKYVRYFDNDAAPAPHWALINRVSRDGTGKGCEHAAALTMVANNATGNFVVSAESRTATVTAYKAGATYALFTLVTDVGRLIRVGFGGRWTWGKILTVVSTSQVTIQLYEDVPRDPHNAANLAGALNGLLTSSSTTGRTYQWRLGAWSDTTGYPSCGAFHEQRLIAGRTDTQPSTFWGSVTGDFENQRPTELDSTVLDDNAIDFTLASGRINAIKWIESGTNLVLGTNGGEWLARSSSATQQPITPSNISVTQQSRNGSSRIALPVRIGSSIVFVDRSETNAIEVAYLYSEDRLADKDLTIVSEHIFRQGGTVIQTAFQQNPDTIAWFLLSDGTLAALTYNQEQEVIAWHRHEITSGTIESICVIPDEAGTSDVLYMHILRTISGVAHRTVELLTPEFIPTSTSRIGMTFVDGCVVVPVAWTSTTIFGLSNLEGLTVEAIVDGTLEGSHVVASGSITLASTPTSEVVVGLPYTATAKSLPLEGGSAHGTSQGMKKRLIEMKVRVLNSFNLNYGWQQSLIAKDLTALTDVRSETAAHYFTGTVPLNPNNPHDLESPWTITQDKPYPLTVLAFIGVVETTQ